MSERQEGQPYPPPNSETVQVHADLQARLPILEKLGEVADSYPDFRPSLSDRVVMNEAVDILLKHQADTQFLDTEYQLINETPESIITRLKRELVTTDIEQGTDDRREDNKILLEIRDELTDEHGQGTKEYFEAFRRLLNNSEELTAKFKAIAAIRDDIKFDGTFSNVLDERKKLVNDNIAALQAMAGASPEYATQVEKAGVDVTDREAVQAFVVESGFMEDATVSEVIKTEVAQRLGIVRTATSMLATLENVRNNDGRFVNADGKTVTFDSNNGVPVGRYTVYPDLTDHTEYVATTMVGGRALRVPFRSTDSPSHLSRIMKAAMVTQVLANRDFQGASRYILGGDGLAAQGMTEIRLDEVQVARAERLFGAFMGLGTVVSTEFPSQSELRSFEWRLQTTHIDGDAKTNDNTGRGDFSWQRLGLLGEDGQLNMNQVEAVGALMNTRSTSLPAFSELERQFGEKEIF